MLVAKGMLRSEDFASQLNEGMADCSHDHNDAFEGMQSHVDRDDMDRRVDLGLDRDADVLATRRGPGRERRFCVVAEFQFDGPQDSSDKTFGRQADRLESEGAGELVRRFQQFDRGQTSGHGMTRETRGSRDREESVSLKHQTPFAVPSLSLLSL